MRGLLYILSMTTRVLPYQVALYSSIALNLAHETSAIDLADLWFLIIFPTFR